MLRSRRCSQVLLGWLGLGLACGPIVVLDDGTGEEPSGGVEPSDGTGVSTTSSTSVGPTSTSTSTTAMTTSVDPTGREPGYCGQVCGVVEDCLQPGLDPSDWACVDGFCEYIGSFPPCDPATCDDLEIGFCTEIDGLSACATPCLDDSECLPGYTECTGHDDLGNSICLAFPCNGAVEGEDCFIEGFGQYGVCFDGECVCTDDSQCDAAGWACKA